MYKPDRKIKAQFQDYEDYIDEVGVHEDGSGFLVSLEGYLTILPISDLEFRVKYGSDAKIERVNDRMIYIYDDSGKNYSFISEPEVIDVIMGEATLYKLR